MTREATERSIEVFVRRLSEHEGRRMPDLTWVDRGGSRTLIHAGHSETVVLNRQILADAADAYFTAAHEYGHIALGHTSRRRNGPLIGAYLLTLLACMLIAATAIAIAAGPGWVAIAPAAGWLAWLPLQRQLSRWLKQPLEHAADLYAARAGAPLTARLAAQYRSRTTGAARVWTWLFPLHPTWTDRLAVTTAAFPDRATGAAGTVSFAEGDQ